MTAYVINYDLPLDATTLVWAEGAAHGAVFIEQAARRAVSNDQATAAHANQRRFARRPGQLEPDHDRQRDAG